jgi:hypothetical protein
MSKVDDLTRLKHIRDAAKEALSFVTNRTREDLDIVWQVITQDLGSLLIEDARIEPTTALIATDNWLEFTLRYVVDYKQRRGKKDQLFTRILDEIDKTDGRIAIASTTIHLVQTPVFDVRVTSRGNDGKEPTA